MERQVTVFQSLISEFGAKRFVHLAPLYGFGMRLRQESEHWFDFVLRCATQDVLFVTQSGWMSLPMRCGSCVGTTSSLSIRQKRGGESVSPGRRSGRGKGQRCTAQGDLSCLE